MSAKSELAAATIDDLYPAACKWLTIAGDWHEVSRLAVTHARAGGDAGFDAALAASKQAEQHRDQARAAMDDLAGFYIREQEQASRYAVQQIVQAGADAYNAACRAWIAAAGTDYPATRHSESIHWHGIEARDTGKVLPSQPTTPGSR